MKEVRKMFGNSGKIAFVDLKTRKATVKHFNEEFYKKFLGGSGFGAYFINNFVKKKTDPLSEGNVLVVASGPWQTGMLPGSGKISVMCKSPLTGTFSDTSAGSNFSVHLKSSGFDAIVVQNKSDKPVYLSVSQDNIEVIDADSLWGVDAYQAHEMLVERHKGKIISTITIGQAGENLVKFACVVSNAHGFGGRGGAGAVMGSKNLKAIVAVQGEMCKVYDTEKLSEFRRGLFEKLKRANVFNGEGTPAVMASIERLGDVPIHHWLRDEWEEGAKSLASPRYTEYLNAKSRFCFGCVIGCHRYVESPSGYKGIGPEYETLALFGTSLDIKDLDTVCAANDIANRYGVDTITMGSLVATVIEGYEAGYIKQSDIGFVPKWGDRDTLINLIDLTCQKRGIGSIVSEGSKKLLSTFNMPESFNVSVKNLDVPAHDPRAFYSLSINYATGNRGACHQRGASHVGERAGVLNQFGTDIKTSMDSMENKELLAIRSQDVACLLNSLTLCFFHLFGNLTADDIVKGINLVTGWDTNIEELMKTSERIFMLQRMINADYGFDRSDDTLPDRFFKAAETGPRKGKAVYDFEKYLNSYYKIRGIDENGKILPETIKRLELDKLDMSYFCTD
jgi:aldehyde:ferredoxin oxidoreductase